MITVYYGNVNKRRNSTLQPTFSDSNKYECILKDNISLDHPTFIFSGNWIGWNVAKWGDRYYFVEDVRAVRNGIWEIECVLDVLATYKSEILNSTQYVCYSSQSGGNWLADTRVPLLKSATHAHEGAVIPHLSSANAFYALTVVGQSGTVAYAVSKAQLAQLINTLQTTADSLMNDIIDGVYAASTFDWTTVEGCIKALSTTSVQSGFLGNAYSQAPSCIRSCIWVPFDPSYFTSGTAEIYLGSFATGITADIIRTSPVMNSVTVLIPWTYSDWRRTICENVSIYLPFVGVIQMSSDELANDSSITVRYGMTATDGVIAYQLTSSDGAIIGTYGGSCCANYAIGINQPASAGEVYQTMFGGIERTVNAGITSSLSPVSMAASLGGMLLEGANAIYEVNNVTNTTNASCIGSFSGGAGSALNLTVNISVTTHPTIIAPSSMKNTMGLPTMKPLQLSTLTGYCQCANAHVPCDATAPEMNAIDTFVNTGFFIE